MHMQADMHDLRAQDPPCLSATNSFKRSLHHALALARPEGWGYTGITHTCLRKMGNKGAGRGESWCCMSVLFCLSNAITPSLALKPSVLAAHQHPVGGFRTVGAAVPCSAHKPGDV